MKPADNLSTFERFLTRHRRLFVLTGAGISTGSGIPAYRDENGDWKRPPPVQYRDFVRLHRVRQRYWARSLVGWPWFERARPNACHETLAEWDRDGRIVQLVTQNVDRLHQTAGSRRVIDLHGRLDRIICLDCGRRTPRGPFQTVLRACNPDVAALGASIGPDGDAYLDDAPFEDVVVPVCDRCGGQLKPDVVFYGETIPRTTVDRTIAALHRADALVVIGSSLMVYSGYRFCRIAAEQGIPIVAVSPGRTRADSLLALKVKARFEDVIDVLRARDLSLDRSGDPRRSTP